MGAASAIIARRAIGAALSLALLSGCLDATGANGSASDGGDLFAVLSTVSRPVGDPLPQAPIAGGDIVIRGPGGYCVDGSSLRNRASGGFALLASCYVMTGGHEGEHVSPAVMTVSAAKGRPGGALPKPQELADALGADRVLARATVKGVSLLHLADGGDEAVPGAAPSHWRGALRINGYVLVLGVYGPEGGEAAGKGGSAMLLDLASSLRSAAPHRMAAAGKARDAAGATAGAAGAVPEGSSLLGLFQ